MRKKGTLVKLSGVLLGIAGLVFTCVATIPGITFACLVGMHEPEDYPEELMQ